MTYRKLLALLLCLVMCLSLFPAPALAEEGIEAAEDEIFIPPIEEVPEILEEPAPEEPAPEEVPTAEAPSADPEPEPVPELALEELAAFEAAEEQTYPEGTVISFEALDEAAVETAYKYALIELEKLFPAALNVTLAGAEEPVSVPVSWRCAEDYDEALDEFHFLPELSLPVAEGVALPVIRVRVLGTLARPVMEMLPQLPGPDLPIVGALSRYPRVWGTLPSYYNAYEQGLLPTIRDQNPYGTCWAHSTIGCMEADLIHDGAAGTGIDLSELHLIYYTYHDYADEKGCSTGDSVSTNGADILYHGGDISLAVKRLSNLVGPAAESAAPYFLNTGYNPGPSAGRQDGSALQLAGAYQMSMDDRDAVKFNIMEHGGVETAYFASDEYYSATYNSYYCFLPYDGTNHSVMLVGWDDNFSRYRFRNTPAGDGAWLVRNSWGGQGYSYYSYFWMSYYDKCLKDTATALDVIDGQYDCCYAYNGSPFFKYYTMGSGVKTEQRFNVSAGETVSAIGVETLTASLNLSVSVTCGSRTVTQSYRTTYPGYYLIPLSQTIPVTTASPVTVQITYTGSNSIGIPVESGLDYGGIVFNANCASGGMTIIYPSGSSFNTNADGLIRLFTNKGASAPAPSVPSCSFSLNLADSIGINFYVGGLADYDGMTIAWTKKDGTAVTRKVTDGEPMHADDGSLSYFFVMEMLTAAEMTVPVPVTVSAADGTVLVRTACSVKAYCEQVDSLSGQYDKLKALCRATLAYGAYSQIFFNTRTDNLASTSLNPAALPTVPSSFNAAAAGSCTGIRGSYISLDLQAQTVLIFSFLPESSAFAASQYEATVTGPSGAVSHPVIGTDPGGSLYIRVTGIAAPNLGDSYSVTLKNRADGSQTTLTASALSYPYLVQDRGDALSNTAKALYDYYLKARAFF